MLCILLMIISIISGSLGKQLYLSVEENTKLSNPIGNLQLMIRNQTTLASGMEFKSFQLNNGIFEKTKIYIKIDSSSGDIMLQYPVDREEVCNLIQNCDGGAILNYLVYVDNIHNFELKIEIIDVNDNSPLFYPDEKVIEIPEDITKFTSFSLPVASDRDSKKYGVQRYILKADEAYFKLSVDNDTKHPYLIVVSELDRESRDHFKFDLFAIDGGGNQGKCQITVKVTDINDNTPQWIGLPYRQQVRECTTDNKIKSLLAVDSDDKMTAGGQIRYKMNDNGQNSEAISRTFHVTEDILWINSGMLRSLQPGRLTVSVFAIDGGGRRNDTVVDIEILDCNDHAPTINVEKPMPTVVENDPAGQKSLTRITVTDQDHGINSEFHCSLNDTSHVTMIQTYKVQSSGIKIFELQTVPDAGFDREQIPRHSIELICVDNGAPAQSSSTVITVFIADQNDNKPRFSGGPYVFTVAEDARVGTDIGRVEATDADVSPNNIVSYSILGDENVRHTFSVTNTGLIHLFRAIDREKIDRYEFRVVAIDSGEPALNDSCQIKVLVLDVNDCKPVILAEHHFTVVESYGQETIYKSLGQLNASDDDSGINGSITFRLKNLMPRNVNPIKVTSDGRLSIYGVIDREKSERIEAEILVIDGGKPPHIASTTVIIEVSDLNDNKPRFIYPNVRHDTFINVSVDLTLGSVIGQIKANDPDKDVNGTIDFVLIGNDVQKRTFVINPEGQIMLNDKLSQRRDERLSIEARDRGTPPHVTSTTLYIRYLKPKNSEVDVKKTGFPTGRKDKPNESNSQKYGAVGWSTVMILIYFLAAAVFLIIVGIGGTFLYLWCRGQWLCPIGESNKNLSSRELNSASYSKNLSKIDNNQSILDINNQFRTTRNETSYQIVDPQCQVLHYPTFTNHYGSQQMDPQYNFRSLMQVGNYSDFHPMLASPIDEKDNRNFSPFNNDPVWDNPTQLNTLNTRNRNMSDNTDTVYDNHKYQVVTNFDNNHHFSTPGQSRRSETLQHINEPTYKTNVKYVASSFV